MGAPKGVFGPIKSKYRHVDGPENLLHRLRAVRALGKPLPEGAQVHHADGSRSDDGPLVICQDAGYHKHLHVRMRVRDAGGDPWNDKICSDCKEPKPKTKFPRNAAQSDGLSHYCASCIRARAAALREAA